MVGRELFPLKVAEGGVEGKGGKKGRKEARGGDRC